MKNWKEVDGWLRDEEGEVLFELAKNSIKGYPIVEIGSWKGKATVCMALGSRLGNGNKILAIDPHCLTDTHRTFRVVDTRVEFNDNLKKYGVADLVISIYKTSRDAFLPGWSLPIGMLFIDGSHEYEDVKYDIETWGQFIASGGVIALHDYDSGTPGVVKAARELITADKFVNIRTIGSLLVATRK